MKQNDGKFDVLLRYCDFGEGFDLLLAFTQVLIQNSTVVMFCFIEKS